MRLQNEKHQMELKGKSLGNHKITRIIRVTHSFFGQFSNFYKNQTKLETTKNQALNELKSLSDLCKSLDEESLDVVCPILAAFCNSSSNLSKNNYDFFDGLKTLTEDFQLREDTSAYIPDVYLNTLFSDYRYENQRELINKGSSNSLIGFIDSRKQFKSQNE